MGRVTTGETRGDAFGRSNDGMAAGKWYIARMGKRIGRGKQGNTLPFLSVFPTRKSAPPGFLW
jgi:hypothetical protein